MMIVTLQTMGTLRPTMSVHGEIIKVDLGPLLLEMDTETFKNTITDIIDQAVQLGFEMPLYAED